MPCRRAVGRADIEEQTAGGKRVHHLVETGMGDGLLVRSGEEPAEGVTVGLLLRPQRAGLNGVPQ
ncbi:hypothetical protein [Streptomyces sp. NPDC006368]|uniref:hypothetical protein n=1 Tax=Streptomyces sp. NPDC006368 TaxID=3156760 RepID=UPI0033A084A0